MEIQHGRQGQGGLAGWKKNERKNRRSEGRGEANPLVEGDIPGGRPLQ